MRRLLYIAAACASLIRSTASAQVDAEGSPLPAASMDADVIVARSQEAFNYAGSDMLARVRMDLVDRDKGKRSRVMTMLRRNDTKGGNQKYFVYFHEPRDVRRLVFMVWKYPQKDDDRWLFIPAVDLIRRIAANDKRSSFVGSDFTYEDISGRDVNADTHTLVREELKGDRNCYVIQSSPREASGYTRRISWIDKESFLPIREEYYDAQEQLFRVFSADRIEDISVGDSAEQHAIPTVTKRTMKNVKTGHRSEVTFDSIVYDVGLNDADFTERRMRRPPREWIKWDID